MPSQTDGRMDAFVRLTPERVLAAVETAGLRATGLCYPLNSFENRVYEVELTDHSRVVAKFYRPGRWRREQILEEHALLTALAEDELPVCTFRRLPNDSTLAETGGIVYGVSDRRGGRAPDELTPSLARRLGRFVGRMHNIAARVRSSTRPRLDAERYIHGPLRWMRRHDVIPPYLEGRYADAAETIAGVYEKRLGTTPLHRIHADLHLGNVLLRDDLLRVLDFDDMAIGPAVQDVWLAVPGRDDESLHLRAALLDGYRTFRDFDEATVRLIEPLRGLRLVRYAGWLARRWDDPAFRVGWPQFGTETYWRDQTHDLEAQLRFIQEEDTHSASSIASSVSLDGGAPRDASKPLLTNKDYFFDWEGD